MIEFDMSSPKDCERLLTSVESYAMQAPRRRPDSMNNYGTILPVDALQVMTTFVNRHTPSLFPRDGGGELYMNRAFTVRYRSGEYLHLDMHTDDSKITCNVCLGRNFAGGDLAFCGGLQNDETNHRRLRHIHHHSQAYAHYTPFSRALLRSQLLKP